MIDQRMQLTVTDDFDRRRDRAPPMVTVFQSLEPTESLMAVTAWSAGDWERTGSFFHRSEDVTTNIISNYLPPVVL